MKKIVNESLKEFTVNKRLNEKAKSEDQQQAAGMALAAKRGEMPVSKLKGAAKSMYDSMSKKELEDFAETEHEGLPEDKKNESVNEDEKWSKDVDVEEGKMHRVLNVPQDEKVEDHYSSGAKLAKDLIDKVGRETAAGMINFAANINSSHNIYDDAQDWLSDNPPEED